MLERISILGSGWLGLPLAIELNQQGYQVKASSRSEERLSQVKQAGISAYIYDIESAENDSDFLQAEILIINITSKNIDAFSKLNKNIENSTIKKVLFISSTSVYKDTTDPKQQLISESNIQALNPCPLLTIEKLFQDNSHFETSIIRFAGLVGYQRHPGRFFLQIQEDGSVKCKPIKNPDAPVNMIHRDDCIGIIKALIQQNHWGEIFNACASDHPSRRKFYSSAVKNFSGKKTLEMNFIEAENKANKIIDNNKVKSVLGYNFVEDNLLDLSFN